MKYKQAVKNCVNEIMEMRYTACDLFESFILKSAVLMFHTVQQKNSRLWNIVNDKITQATQQY